ncbi:MAG: hypothetical protein DRO13_06325 [Thermoprotei archaeon]|nr:MAG: hypothetical protein DRO13_06325 [Thermoprotei archaeon]
MKQPLIEHYSFGRIVVGGREYGRDIVITPTRIVDGWWRAEGHRLQLEDVREYLDVDADVVVIGTGYNGFMRVEREVVEEFAKRGREVYVDYTKEAVKVYNELVGLGKKVLAFFHLTC